MYILNDDTQNYPICRLQLVFKRLVILINELTNQNSRKVFKVVKQKNKKWKHKNLELCNKLPSLSHYYYVDINCLYFKLNLIMQ